LRASGITLRSFPSRESRNSLRVVPAATTRYPPANPSTRGQDSNCASCLSACSARGPRAPPIGAPRGPQYCPRVHEGWCKARLTGLSEAEIREREGTSSASATNRQRAGSLTSKRNRICARNILGAAGQGVDTLASIRQAIRAPKPPTEEETKDKKYRKS